MEKKAEKGSCAEKKSKGYETHVLILHLAEAFYAFPRLFLPGLDAGGKKLGLEPCMSRVCLS